MLAQLLEKDAIKALLNAIPEAVCIVDTEGVVVFWSKGSEVLFKIKAEEITGRKLADFFPTALLLSILKEKRVTANVFHSPREGCYAVVSARPLYLEGKIVGALSTDKDVTEITKLAEELEKTKNKLKHLQEEIYNLSKDNYSFEQILGKSEILKKQIERAKQVAQTSASVLIEGESGTGKEMFARAIHSASRRKGPFVAINCSAIPDNLFESEMFGYVEGAFTGALKKGKVGKYELADKGTLFLDEIGDMPAHMQAKLLRVLQENKVTRIGAYRAKSVDVRVISASNKNLRALVSQGKFREDLFYRLNVVKIILPPLRRRQDDIPLLIDHFAEKFCSRNNIKIPKISVDVYNALMNYSWKGNIRELKNVVEHLIIFSKDNKIDLEDIPKNILEHPASCTLQGSDRFDLQKNAAVAEIEAITRAMRMVKGNKSKAARILNIPRSTLYYKLNYYKLNEFLEEAANDLTLN